MKKITLIFLSFIFLNSHSIAQGCLPNGITLSMQSQVDSFPINYPGCTQILGPLQLYADDINNLDSLYVLTSIGSWFAIEGMPNLISLNGLHNLTAIGNSEEGYGGSLFIGYNDSLTNLIALSNLTSIDGDLSVVSNPVLTSLSGLENIDPDSIENLEILYNNQLTNCEIENICTYLQFPNGSVRISDNGDNCSTPTEIASTCGITISCLPFGDYIFNNQDQLDNFQTDYPGCTDLEGAVYISGNNIDDLSGLNEVTSINKKLIIINNTQLVNLNGLENLESIGNGMIESTFRISFNEGLVSLEGLSTLDTINASLYISSNPNILNLTGLDSVKLISGNLSISSNDNLIDFMGLNSLTSINRNLTIQNNDVLVDFNGINSLQHIARDLLINNNNSLNDLAGLENLSYCGGSLTLGSLSLGNPELTSLNGLNNLTEIGNNLSIYNSNSLVNISDLSSLNSIGGSLRIINNFLLGSLEGLDSLMSIGVHLYIYGNAALSTCEYQAICSYLENPNGTIIIYDNNLGCNSQSEVEEACTALTIPENDLKKLISLYPNPASDKLNIENEFDLKIDQVLIHNQMGQQVLFLNNIDQVIDISELQSGIYFIEVQSSIHRQRQKLIIEK